MTVDDIEALLKETEHKGYPVVVSHESQYLVGFVLRREINLAIGTIAVTLIRYENYIRLIFQLTPVVQSTASVVNPWSSSPTAIPRRL